MSHFTSNIVECTLVGWCEGHRDDETESHATLLHTAPDIVLKRGTEDSENPHPGEIVVWRTLDATSGHERYNIDTTYSRTVRIEDIADLAADFEEVAAQLRAMHAALND
ncbi:DUF6907 domain-containing protein [Leifsonia sp. NPDC056824]|uniref:DUF6907 domain-containing protein n=1 Tax=Leifsonia sp. NPDC056824 TaxID=3345953 RepID=UPI0036BEE60F